MKKLSLSGSEYWLSKTESALLIGDEYSELYGTSWRPGTLKVGYARVSTKDQTLDLQLDALKKVGCSKIYTETMSGAKADRPVLAKLMDAVRAGDVLVIWKLDRLGRSLKNLIDIVNDLLQRKVGLKSLGDPSTPPLLMGG